jgi:hypothetical protein
MGKLGRRFQTSDNANTGATAGLVADCSFCSTSAVLRC